MSDFEIKISERVSKLETDIYNIKEDVKVLSGIENAITKLSTLMEVQTSSIENIHKEIKDTRSEIKDTRSEIKITNNKVEDLEWKFSNSENKSQIDIREIARSTFFKWVFPASTLFAILGGILKFFKLL